MSNLLGVNFYRAVSEPRANDWAQVYAKIPFDQTEVGVKGGVFGVVALSGSGVMEEGGRTIANLEECFNNFETGDLLKELRMVLGGVRMAMVQMVMEEDRRVLRVVGGGGRVRIYRDGQGVVLVDRGSSDAVVVGEVKSGDRIVIEVLAEGEDFGEANWGTANLELEVDGWVQKQGGVVGALMVLEIGELEISGEPEAVEPIKLIETDTPAQPMARSANLLIKWPKWLWQKGSTYVQRKHPWRKYVFIAGIVFLNLLVISVGFGWWRMNRQKSDSDFEKVYASFDRRRREAFEMYSINPSGARELMSKLREEVESNNTYRDGKYKARWSDLTKNIEEGWVRVSGEEVASFETIYDLSLVRAGFVGDGMVFGGTQGLLIWDNTTGAVVKFLYPGRNVEVVAGKNGNEKIEAAVWWEDKPIVFSGKKWRMDQQSLGEVGAVVGSVVAAEPFGKSVYLLDRDNGEVWRMPWEGGAFGHELRWIKGQEVPSLKKGVALGIDGDLWVGLEDGQVERWRRGEKESFVLSGASGSITIGDMVVLGEVKNGAKLILLDTAESRLVFFDEKGVYVRQIKWSGLSKVKAIEVVGGDIIAMGEGKLYKIGW